MQCIMMHVYLLKKYRSPFLHRLPFSIVKSLSINSSSVLFCLLEPSLVLLTSRNNKFLDCVFMIPACVKTFIFNFVQHPLSSQKGNVRANHIMFIVLLWPDYVLKCSRFFLGMKSCRTRLVIYKDHFLVKFWNFKAIPSTKAISTLV